MVSSIAFSSAYSCRILEGREGRREGERGRERGKEGGRERGKEGGREGGREGKIEKRQRVLENREGGRE